MKNLQQRNRSASFIMLFGVLINFALFGVKLWIGLASNNIGILSDAINNLGDVLSCILSLICFYLLFSKKQSEKFPHGLGRLEQISSLIMSMLIIVVGGYFFISSLNRMMIASLVRFKWTYFIILLATVFVKVAMAVFYYYKNKKIVSDILCCAFFDSVLDASVTLMTVIGLLLTKYVQLRLDGIFGIIVSSVMTVGGIKLFVSNIIALLGRKMPDDDMHAIFAKLSQSEQIKKINSTEYHDYGSGNKELLVNATFTNDYSHDILKTICTEILDEYGIKILFIHEV